jgi:hypothetical protein
MERRERHHAGHLPKQRSVLTVKFTIEHGEFMRRIAFGVGKGHIFR